MKRLVAEYPKTLGTPVSASLGIHEGIRGARWIEVDDTGVVRERRYLPNKGGDSSVEVLGALPIKRFCQLVEHIEEINFKNASPPVFGAPNQNSISLECSWDDCRWEFSFPAFVLDRFEELARLRQEFLQLAQDAGEARNGDPH